jgi:pyruvate kinase
LNYEEILEKMEKQRMKDNTSALGYATVSTAMNLDAKCIIAPTGSGATARIISKFHPEMEVLAVSPNERTLRRMQILCGVRSYKSEKMNSPEDISNNAIATAKEKGHVEAGDLAVLTAGIPSPHVGGFDYGVSNMMRIVTIE